MPDSPPLPNIQAPWGQINPGRDGIQPDPAPPPVVVPDHTLLRAIGQGAYGEVWLARNALGQYRAVKVVRRQSFNDDRPFEREFAGMQRFEPVSRSHESQLNILHVGRGPDHFYYVMELADDQRTGPAIDEATYSPRTLRSDLLARGRLPVDECLRLGLALTTALGHLHRHGLVHRDIKPSNIVFVNGIPKLADIGLVAVAERTMSFVGTEGYLPPEGPGTVQADLFSLGKVLYEISTGHDRQEFPELPTDLAEMPDRLALAEFNEVLVRACAPEARRRYQTAEEMHADLALLQSGRSVARLRRLARQLRVVQRAGALVTALAFVIAGGWVWQARQTRVVRDLADEKSRLAEENRERVLKLNLANGVRQWDAGDPGGALLWFAEALPLVTNRPAAESVHRIRIAQAIREIPRLHQMLAHEGEVSAVAFSQDGGTIATGTAAGRIQLWDPGKGQTMAPPLDTGVGSVDQLRFFAGGQRLFVASPPHPATEGGAGAEHRAAVLDTQSGGPILVLTATNRVTTALSPDGRWLVSADISGTLHLHDAVTGRAEGRISGLTNQPLQLEFSADGNLVAASATDFPARFQSVRVWRLPGGEPVGGARRCARGPIAFSPDGQFLAVAAPAADGGNDTLVQSWELASWDTPPSVTRLPGALRTLRISSPQEGSFLVLTEQQCVVLDTRQGRAKSPSFVPPREASVMAVSPDRRLVAFAGLHGFAGAWSVDQGRQVLPALAQEVEVDALEFSPDGRQLLVGCRNGVALVLGVHLLAEDGLIRFDAPLGAGSQDRMDLRGSSPDRRHLQVILDDGSVHLVTLDQLAERRLPSGSPQRSRAMQAIFDPSGRRRAVHYGRTVVIWGDPRESPAPVQVHVSQGQILDLQFTADGASLAAVCSDGRVRRWKTSDGSLQQEVAIPEPALARWLAGSTRILVKSPGSGPLQVMNPMEQPVPEPTPIPPGIHGVSSSPAGDRFATLGPGSRGQVWRTAGFEPVTPPLDHGSRMDQVEWSPDGRQLLTTGSSPEVRIWDALTGGLRLAPLALGTLSTRFPSWSLDGRFIAAASDDGMVRVWDAATGDPVTARIGHRGPLLMARLVAGGRLVTLSEPELLRVWDLDPCPLPAEAITDLATLLSGRRLTGAGATQRLAASELARLFAGLRTTHPGLFTTSRRELIQWHRREVGLTLDLTGLRTALFHLDRLAELAPEDEEIRWLRALYQARQIPPRSPETPANLLDLSRFYGSSLDTTMYGELARLPRGHQTLAGTPWDVRGSVMASPGEVVKGIPVRQRCQQVNFLQFVGGFHARDGDEVAHWVIRYSDGSTEEWPLIYGEQVRDWWWNYGHPREARQAVIAWEDHPDVLANSVRLFKATWTNPRLEAVVESLDLVGGDADVTTVVVAITAQ